MLRKQDLANTVRNPINANEARQLLDHLESWNGTVSNQWKVRANTNQETMDRGDPFGYAEVYMGLSKLESQGTLRATDREHLNRSLDFLVEELAVALGKTPEQARNRIAKVEIQGKLASAVQ